MTQRPHLSADGLYYEKEKQCAMSLILLYKTSPRNITSKCLIKIKFLIEMLVLGGGRRFYFYANKKGNYRNEKIGL